MLLNKKLVLKSLKPIIWIMFILYILALNNIVILKGGDALLLARMGMRMSFLEKISQINITPLINTIIPYLRGEPSIYIALKNLLGNIFVFSPLGFFLPILFKKCSEIRSVFLFSFGISLFIELLQFVFHLGTCDVDDIILNVFGTIIGFGVYCLFKRLNNKR